MAIASYEVLAVSRIAEIGDRVFTDAVKERRLVADRHAGLPRSLSRDLADIAPDIPLDRR